MNGNITQRDAFFFFFFFFYKIFLL